MSYLLKKDGFQIVPSILNGTDVEFLRNTLTSLSIAPGHRSFTHRIPEIAALAVSPKILDLLEKIIGARPFPVRSIYFDKTPEANWLVPYHQDLSIAVKERSDLSGYGPWSIKEGTLHVQPPIEILEAMVTVRLHLDDCDESNGPLRVIPGSHRQGRLNDTGSAEVRSKQNEVICSVLAGDALLMRPLLLHASSEARTPAHRRVIHLEYATCQLAGGLEWAEVIKATSTQFHSA